MPTPPTTSEMPATASSSALDQLRGPRGGLGDLRHVQDFEVVVILSCQMMPVAEQRGNLLHGVVDFPRAGRLGENVTPPPAQVWP